MAATQLSLYNKALLLAGDRAVTLSEITSPTREAPRLLNQLYNDEDQVTTCLEAGQWRFAMRTIKTSYDPTITPAFGYKLAVLKPADWVLTSGVCQDEFFRAPFTMYYDERGYWWSDLATIYIRYISNDVNYGKNLALWPNSFADYVGAHLAYRFVLKVTDNKERLDRIDKIRDKFLKFAKSRAAMSDATQWPAQGSWSRSRQRWLGVKDGGGSSGGLIG